MNVDRLAIFDGLAIFAVAAMEELDADNKRLSYQGRFADRDIVQVCCALVWLCCMAFSALVLCAAKTTVSVWFGIERLVSLQGS